MASRRFFYPAVVKNLLNTLAQNGDVYSTGRADFIHQLWQYFVHVLNEIEKGPCAMANSNRLSAENGIYIDNYIEPDDGSIKFIDNAVVKYYEKKVYNLKRGSWESQTEVAVKNDQLYLIINNGRKYPDNFGFSKGISGYYVSFTINIDEEIMQQLSYYGISSAGTELVSGKLMERIEGFVKGISSVIPKDQRTSYLKHLISKKGSKLALIHIGKGCAIQTVGFIPLKNYTCVYGYQSMTGSDAAAQSHGKAVSIASHIDYNSSASVPYIEDFIEPKNGKMIFENGMVYTYFERKVYSLKGSWEKGTQEAIRHKQLFLIIDGIRRYPDHDGINRAPKGFYLPFTVVTANPPATQTKIGNKNTLR
ncbi:uncharacterized protein TRIADDRAFT_57032 [Trichoplax adhaerens]|uniref:Uncharacterized protein n=1 Tax=Trichoplax adhaerens TaxID=10228 RepID=B3S0F7_TRIAD|nr:predicted protein [Trichoplax adhaerens]EDV24006.1 predicted protein [Trichoplax adhaerens]|eukprot:XP_002113532.1 predicted protein [Trichoplax adhaerens]